MDTLFTDADLHRIADGKAPSPLEAALAKALLLERDATAAVVDHYVQAEKLAHALAFNRAELLVDRDAAEKVATDLLGIVLGFASAPRQRLYGPAGISFEVIVSAEQMDAALQVSKEMHTPVQGDGLDFPPLAPGEKGN